MTEPSLTEALDLLRHLNAARRHGNFVIAGDIDRGLEVFARDRGYSRSRSEDYAAPVPSVLVKSSGQRNPNWRAALDKLNAMRGRAR